MNNSCQAAALRASGVKFRLRPSAQFTIPTESIPDNGVLALRCHSHLFAFFRHIVHPSAEGNHNTAPQYYTHISVVDLATERTIFALRYTWKGTHVCGRTLPPQWVHSPSLQVCDLAISEQMLAFATSELVLVYTHAISANAASAHHVAAISLDRIVNSHYAMYKVTRTCLAVSRCFACVLVQGSINGVPASLVFLVDTALMPPKVLLHYKLAHALDVKNFAPNNVLCMLRPTTFVMLVQFQDSQCQTQLRAIHLPVNDGHINILPSVHDIQPHSRSYLALLTETVQAGHGDSISVCCQCPSTFSDGYLEALNDLSRTFSMPFFSLVASDTSKINLLSSRLNSPWAMPIALMHLLLFIMLFPFLFLPEHTTEISFSLLPAPSRKDDTSKEASFNETSSFNETLLCRRRHRFLKRPIMDGPFANYHQLFRAGPHHHYSLSHLPQHQPAALLLQKLSPSPLSKSAYSQPDTFRTLSILCYLTCLLVFSVSMLLLFRTVKGVKVDLIVEIAIADAASVYLLAICQDLVLAYSVLAYKVKAYFHAKSTALPYDIEEDHSMPKKSMESFMDTQKPSQSFHPLAVV